jgi:hypothetical protein
MTPLSIAVEAAATAFAQARALRRRGRDADAILWFQEAVRRDSALGAASFEAGELCLWHGRSDEAERHLGDALRWAAAAACPGLPRPRQGTGKGVGAGGGMDPGAARTALFAALDTLAAAGIVAFLNGGTALGCVREGDFISFDSDIDLGVAPGTEPDAVIEAIDAAPGLHYQYHDIHAGQVLRVRFASEDGIGGDVFLYQCDAVGWWCGVQRGPTAIRWRDTPFALAETGFLGRTVLVPDPAERYLTENYGDWRRPDPFHVAAFSAPNLIGGYGALPRCAAYRAICLALLGGDPARARHLCREVLRRDAGDTVVADIVAALA